MKLWQMLLTAAGVVKNVVSGFGTTVKGGNVNETSGTSTIAVNGAFRYIYGSTGSGSTDPIIAGVTMNKNAGTRWISRIDNTGQPLWIAAIAAGNVPDTGYSVAVTDDGKFLLTFVCTAPVVLYNANGTTFTPADTLANRAVVCMNPDGTWAWGRTYNYSGSNLAIRSIATAGTHIIISISGPNSLTYGGSTYTTTFASGTLLWMTTAGVFTGHVFATSTIATNCSQAIVDTNGVAHWFGQNTEANGGTLRPITINGTTINHLNSVTWFARLTLTTCQVLRTIPGTGYGINLENLPDGGIALLRFRSSTPLVLDYGNGVVLTHPSGSSNAVVRFNSSLVAQVGRVLTGATATGRLQGIAYDDQSLYCAYILQANDTIAGTAITATTTNYAYVVHKITNSTLADVWAIWAGAHDALFQDQGRQKYYFTDGAGTGFTYLRVYPNTTGTSLVLTPGAITYTPEAERYEVFATHSDAGVWQTP